MTGDRMVMVVGVEEVPKVTISLLLSDSLGTKVNDAWLNTGR